MQHTHRHRHTHAHAHTHLPGGQLFAAAVFLNEREFVSGEGFVLVNVAESRHEWTDDHFSVVLEKVDLRRGGGILLQQLGLLGLHVYNIIYLQQPTGKVQYDGTPCPKPRPQVG